MNSIKLHIMNVKKFSSLGYSIICLVGFLAQVQQVSELYFRFQTTSKTVFEIRETDYFQTIIYCPRSVDILDRTRYSEYGILPETPKSLEEAYHDLGSLTIKDFIELTPPQSEAIERCDLRLGLLSAPLTVNRKECETFFKVIKSVNGERICYTFSPRSLKNYSVGDVASFQTHTSVIYEICPNPKLAKSRLAFFISLVMNPKSNVSDIFHSRAYQARIYNKLTFNQSGFTIVGESIEIHRLPAPYDTTCTPGHDREICYELCLIEKLKVINKIPWSGFHQEKLDIQMLTGSDLKNDSILRLVSESFGQCHTNCKRQAECLTQFSRTIIQEYQSNRFCFVSIVPSLPHMSLYAAPFLNLIEFVVQVGSCFGIWFGLSITSLDPTKVFRSQDTTSRMVNNRYRRLFFLSTKITRH